MTKYYFSSSFFTLGGCELYVLPTLPEKGVTYTNTLVFIPKEGNPFGQLYYLNGDQDPIELPCTDETKALAQRWLHHAKHIHLTEQQRNWLLPASHAVFAAANRAVQQQEVAQFVHSVKHEVQWVDAITEEMPPKTFYLTQISETQVCCKLRDIKGHVFTGILTQAEYPALFSEPDEVTAADLMMALAKQGHDLSASLSVFDNAESIFRARTQQNQLAASLGYWQKRLAEIRGYAPCFHKLSESTRKRLEIELRFALYQFYAEFQLHWVEQQKQLIPDNWDQVNQCLDVLIQLQQVNPELMKANLADTTAFKQHLYALAQSAEIKKRVTEKFSVTTWMIEWISYINQTRFYVLWVRMMLSIWVAGFIHSPEQDLAQMLISSPARYTGQMSWSLYLVRGALNWVTFHKHVIYLTEEEAAMKLGSEERSEQQWDVKQYTLSNDTIWGSDNFMCFFFWFGKGVFGWLGDASTTVLLGFDLMMAKKRNHESKHRFDTRIIHYDTSIADIERVKAGLDLMNPDAQAQLMLLEADRAMLEAEKNQQKFEWMYQENNNNADVTYAKFLIGAFFIACCCLIPPLAIVPYIGYTLICIGATTCFLSNVLYDSYTSYLPIQRTIDVEKKMRDQIFDIRRDWHAMNKDDQYMAVCDYQRLETLIEQQQAPLEKAKQLWTFHRGVQVVLPPLFFVSIMLLPTGVGLPLLASTMIGLMVVELGLHRDSIAQSFTHTFFKPEPVAVIAHQPATETFEAAFERFKCVA